TVLQTRLSEAAHQERHADLLRDLATALRTTIAIAAPVGILVSVLRVPIIQLIFERGAFDSTATQRVAALLPWMLPGMVAMLCVVMLFKALFARGDLRAGVVLGVLGPAMYFALSGWLSGLFGVRGIGAAYSITWITIATVGVDSLYRTRERGWRVLHRSTVVFAGKLSGAIAVSGAVTGFATHLLFHEAGSLNTVGLALRIAAASAFGASTYLAIAVYVWRIPELSAVLRALKIDFN
ncbi:MAG TPA: lipid II flippase MurJ, partial [Gemmatimonadaceae bacterium]|nr:lipid II flippase MurJ [Gemmatimonadaceae bacterium]